jgi:Ca-activated chloride channel family protein
MKRFHYMALAAVSGIALVTSLAACTSGAAPEVADGRARVDSGEQDAAVAVTGTTAETRDLAVVAPPYVMAPPAPPPPPSQAMAGMVAPKMAMPSPAQLVPQPQPGDVLRDKYEDVEINPVKVVAEEPVSTFSIDVDTASYSNVRRMINQGYLPPKDAVRIEEMINYFDYEYALPKSKSQPFETTVKIVPSPWAEGRQLMHVAIQGYDIKPDARAAAEPHAADRCVGLDVGPEQAAAGGSVAEASGE